MREIDKILADKVFKGKFDKKIATKYMVLFSGMLASKLEADCIVDEATEIQLNLLYLKNKMQTFK